jgi:hypothetical protein
MIRVIKNPSPCIAEEEAIVFHVKPVMYMTAENTMKRSLSLRKLYKKRITQNQLVVRQPMICHVTHHHQRSWTGMRK